MRVAQINNAFYRDVSQKYAQETDIYCAICGDGIYPNESVSWDDQNQICHDECVKEEEYEG